MTSYRQQLGRRVVRFREAKGWNQEDLAYHSGVSNRTIQRIENGQHEGRVKTTHDDQEVEIVHVL